MSLVTLAATLLGAFDIRSEKLRYMDTLFCYDTSFTLPKQSQRSRWILLDGSRFWGMIWKEKKLCLITEEIWYLADSFSREKIKKKKKIVFAGSDCYFQHWLHVNQWDFRIRQSTLSHLQLAESMVWIYYFMMALTFVTSVDFFGLAPFFQCTDRQ